MKAFARALTLGLIGVLTASLVAGCGPSTANMIGKPAPYARLITLDGGEPAVLEQYRGHPTVIIFWASWCPHCKPVITELNEISRNMRNAGNQTQFVAISVDKAESLEQLRAKIGELNLKYFDHYFSGNEFLDDAYLAFQGTSIPYVAVLDESGNVLSIGHSTSVVTEALHPPPAH